MAGKSYREGISTIELAEMFPTEDSAREWFESKIWPNGRTCPHCKSTETIECRGNPPLPYWCPACKSYFSVRVGTLMHRSKISFKKWVWAIFLHLTSLKGVSSVKLGRDIGVRQATAWFMLQRIRKAFDVDDGEDRGQLFKGPAEADETYIGGKRKNKSNAARKAATGRGAVDMEAIVGVKDRETKQVAVAHVGNTEAITLGNFVAQHAKFGSKVYTDESAAYNILDPWYDHESVNHSAKEFVKGMAHTNGIESFWAMFKRGIVGTYHKLSAKHLHRYAAEFAGRHNLRERDTLAQMAELAAGMAGKRLTYAALIADNGLPSGARS